MIFGGEGHFHVARVAGRNADQPIFKARNEGARPQGQAEVLALAPGEFHPIHAAGIIDDDGVILLGGAILGGIVADILGEAVQRFVHVGVGNVGDQPFHGQLGDVGGLEFGHQVHDHLEGEVGLAGHHVFDAAHRLDTRLQRGLELVVGNGLLAALGDGGFHHLAHDGLAELLLEKRDRRLAGTEALEIDLGLHFLQARIHTAVQLAGRHGDRELLVQILGNRLVNLHVECPALSLVGTGAGRGT